MSKQERPPIKSTIDGQRESNDPQKPIGYIDLIRQNSNFRWLWCGQLVSLLGDWFNLIASMILMADLTDSGLAIGVLFTIRMFAPFVVAPLAGICADRYNRKYLLIITDLVRVVIVFGFFLSGTKAISGCSIRSRRSCSPSAASSVRLGVRFYRTLRLRANSVPRTPSVLPHGR